MRKILMIITGFIISAFLLSSMSGSKSNFDGKIIFISGNVTINGETAYIDEPVFEKSEIVTGKDSACEIVFNKKNIIHIIENSDIEMDMSGNIKNLNIKSGGGGNVLKNLPHSSSGNADLFRVHTSTAALAVRGTTFFIKVEDNDNTYVCICNGIATLSDSEGINPVIIKSAHHSDLRFSRTAAGIVYTKAGLLYHDDKSVNLIAAKIGVKINWSKPD